MKVIHRDSFCTFHQGVTVTLSLLQDGDKFIVRCQPRGYPLRGSYETPCGSLAEAEAIYTRKFNVGMTGEP